LKKFEHIDHTADVGLIVYGDTLPRLFEHAAEGLFDVIADQKRITPDVTKEVRVDASDLDALLVAWLSELNYLFYTELIIFQRFTIRELTGTRLTASASGELLDLDKHEIYTEVKAITYHQLYVKETPKGWQAQVIFDL